MIVTLTPVEHALSRRIAMLRYESNRKKGNVNHLRIPDKYEAHEMNGFGAELAVCKALNVYPDLSISEAPAADLQYKNADIDVKQSSTKSAHLLLAAEKVKLCEWYCLVIGDMPVYDIVGFARLDDLRREENLKDFGYGATYALSQDKLMDILDFVKTVQE